MKNNLHGNKLIKVKVFPNSGKEEILRKGDRLVIKVKEEDKKGRANKRVIEILSFIFPEKGIELVKGSKRKNKIFKLHEKN